MVGRGGNSRNWLSPLFMLIHYSMAKYDNIPGCPGYYISKRGQIYSRVIPNGDDAGKLGKVWRERKVKIMVKTPTYSTKRVKIRNKSYSVLRLVALAWVPNPDNKPCVCHKDNDPLNNHYKNLYWGTVSENNAQKQTDGRARVYSDRLRLRVYRYKLRHPNTTSRYLAQKFKISKTKARSIVTGKDYVIKKTYFL